MKVNIFKKNHGRQKEYQNLKEKQQMCRKAKEEHFNNLYKELEELD